MPETKVCVSCGSCFERTTKKTSNWKRRKYCTRSCAAITTQNDPTIRAKVSASMKHRLATDPAAKARHHAAASRNIIGAHLKADRRKQDATRSFRQTGFVFADAEEKSRYKYMQQQFGATEAKRMLREERAAIEKRRLAAMTPHERNLERVRNGATISEKAPMRKVDHAMTLGGVASYG